MAPARRLGATKLGKLFLATATPRHALAGSSLAGWGIGAHNPCHLWLFFGTWRNLQPSLSLISAGADTRSPT